MDRYIDKTKSSKLNNNYKYVEEYHL